MNSTLMAQEAKETPSVTADQIANNQTLVEILVNQLEHKQPSLVYMIGRGSSSHAGVFAKYLFEVELGIPVAFSAPSVGSVFNRPLSLDNALAIVISQSGRSSDIVQQMHMAKDAGALCVAIVNDAASPVADLADVVLPLHAGSEKAVAATKSYMASLSALLHVAAVWKNDTALLKGLQQLPEQLTQAQSLPALLTPEHVENISHCVVLGRGFGYAIAREVALKCKEICGLHAESFSSAEFLHGPVALVEKQLLLLNIDIADETQSAHQEQIQELLARGAKLVDFSLAETGIHPRLLPLIMMQRIYLDLEHLSVSLGFDPDNPVGLKKVTLTL